MKKKSEKIYLRREKNLKKAINRPFWAINRPFWAINRPFWAINHPFWVNNRIFSPINPPFRLINHLRPFHDPFDGRQITVFHDPFDRDSSFDGHLTARQITVKWVVNHYFRLFETPPGYLFHDHLTVI